MKKLVLSVLFLSIILIFSSCGNSQKAVNTSSENSGKTVTATASPDNVTNTSEPVSQPIGSGNYTDFKTALSSFITDYINTKKPNFDIIDKSPDKNALLFDLLGLYSADLSIVEVPMYDAINPTSNGPRVEGKLMLSGYDAFKEKNGAIIKCGSSYTFDKDQGNNQKNDKITTVGSFDTSKQFLSLETILVRAGKKITRTIMEVSKHQDGSYSMQNITYNSRSTGSPSESVFLNFTNKSLSGIIATGDKNVDFNYKSMNGLDSVSLEDISNGYKASLTLKVDDSKFSYMKN